jgi:hypothetical protein
VHTFQASNVKIEERNSQILTELNQIMDRYKLGIDNIRKSDGLLQEQKEGLNRYVLSNFGGM